MRGKRLDATVADLNLLPVMNLMAVLIPFLLMAAQFVSLSVVDAAIPAVLPGVPDPSAPKLNLWVAIGHDGFTVTGTDPMLHRDGRDDARLPCLVDGCPGPETYDVAGLSRLLGWVKDEWPDERTVVIAPAADLPYEVVVRAMDAARGAAVGDDATRRDLFTDVVIATLPKAEGGTP